MDLKQADKIMMELRVTPEYCLSYRELDTRELVADVGEETLRYLLREQFGDDSTAMAEAIHAWAADRTLVMFMLERHGWAPTAEQRETECTMGVGYGTRGLSRSQTVIDVTNMEDHQLRDRLVGIFMQEAVNAVRNAVRFGDDLVALYATNTDAGQMAFDAMVMAEKARIEHHHDPDGLL